MHHNVLHKIANHLESQYEDYKIISMDLIRYQEDYDYNDDTYKYKFIAKIQPYGSDNYSDIIEIEFSPYSGDVNNIEKYENF